MPITLEYKPEWIREDFVDFIAEKFDPIWAWRKVKAEIVQLTSLSSDFIQIQLRPNHNFKAKVYQAGQSVLVTVVVAGVRQQRSYSIVRILQNGDVVIAVKKQGLVSNALSSCHVGSVVELSQPQGDFRLRPSSSCARVLIASGSGITAIYALLIEHLAKSQNAIDLIYFTRDDAYVNQLSQLADQYPNFHLHVWNTLQTKQHFSSDLLKECVADYAERECYACGAATMMQSIQAHFIEQGLRHQLYMEYFQIMVDETLEAQPVKFLRAQQAFQAKTNLLESAERAGLKPAHGCRMGICNTCSCTKVQGSVKNILTGEIDSQNNTQIKLCISQAISPVSINL